MVWQIIHGGNIDYRRLDVRIPWLDGMLHPMLHNPYYASSPLMIERLFESFPAPRVFKTHLPYDLVPKPCDQATKPRYICVMRNPKDTAVSFYHHSEVMPETPHRSWDEYFELFIKGEGILSLLWKAMLLSLSLLLHRWCDKKIFWYFASDPLPLYAVPGLRPLYKGQSTPNCAN